MTRLDNLKGHIHTLTHEDRVNGGKTSSSKKSKANAFKNLKHGNHSKFNYPILSCVDCPYFSHCLKRSNGYCAYLVKDIAKDQKLRKKVMKYSSLKEKGDIVTFTISLYSLRKMYVDYLRKYFR